MWLGSWVVGCAAVLAASSAQLCASLGGVVSVGPRPALRDPSANSTAARKALKLLREFRRRLPDALDELLRASRAHCAQGAAKTERVDVGCWRLEAELRGHRLLAMGTTCRNLSDHWNHDARDHVFSLLWKAMHNCTRDFENSCDMEGTWYNRTNLKIQELADQYTPLLESVAEALVLSSFNVRCSSQSHSHNCADVRFNEEAQTTDPTMLLTIMPSVICNVLLFVFIHITHAVFLDRLGDQLPRLLLHLESSVRRNRDFLRPSGRRFRDLILDWAERDANADIFELMTRGERRRVWLFPEEIDRAFSAAQEQLASFPPMRRSDLCHFNFWDWRNDAQPPPAKGDRIRRVDLRIWLSYTALVASGMAVEHVRSEEDDGEDGTYATLFNLAELDTDSENPRTAPFAPPDDLRRRWDDRRRSLSRVGFPIATTNSSVPHTAKLELSGAERTGSPGTGGTTTTTTGSGGSDVKDPTTDAHLPPTLKPPIIAQFTPCATISLT